MANHVTTNVHIQGNPDMINWLKSKLDDVEITDNVFHEMSSEQTAKLFYENEFQNTYEWMLENVGAKWCYINEWNKYDDTELHITITSAWSFPEPLINEMFYVCQDVDDDCVFRITYEDESLDPIGAMYISKNGSHIEESSYAWPMLEDYETESEYENAVDFMWEEIGDLKDDLLATCEEIAEEDEEDEDEGSDIYTEDDFADWDITLMDGLEDEEDDF